MVHAKANDAGRPEHSRLAVVVKRSAPKSDVRLSEPCAIPGTTISSDSFILGGTTTPTKKMLGIEYRCDKHSRTIDLTILF